VLLSDEPSRREEAEALYRRVLVLDPDNVQALCNFALQRIKASSGLDEAEAMCRRALVLVSDGVRALDVLGNILTQDPERLDEAEQVLRRALEIEPDNSSPQASLCVCLSARGGAGDMAEALQLCQQAVAGAASEGAEARVNALAAHGIVLVRSGDAVAARAKLVEAQGLAVSAGAGCKDNHYFTDLGLLLEQHTPHS